MGDTYQHHDNEEYGDTCTILFHHYLLSGVVGERKN
jgi:hypothetical protein